MEKEDAFEKASTIILDLVCLAGPMMPREEPRSTEVMQSSQGKGEGDLPRFHPMSHMDSVTIAKDIRPAEFRAWTSKFMSFMEVSTRG